MFNKAIVFASLTAFFAGGAATLFLAPRVMAAAQADVPYETDLGDGAPTKILLDNNTLRVTMVDLPKDFVRKGGLKRRADQLIVFLDKSEYTTGTGARNPNAPPNPGAGGPQVGKPIVCDPVKDCGPISPDGMSVRSPNPSGTVLWHPKDTMSSQLNVQNGFRLMYIELKKDGVFKN